MERTTWTPSLHPAADLFPLMGAAEFGALKADIAAHGVREAVWVYRGQLLDGRHRARACDELGLTCPTREYEGADPLAFVISLNLQRRHLSESQRAMIAERLATMPSHRPGKSADLPTSQPEAAELLNVSERLLRDARAVRKADPEKAAEVERGEKTVTQAKREIKERVRQDRRDENADKIAATPTLEAALVGTFSTIVVDPPWDWGDEGDVDQLGRARPEYGTMSFESLMALPIEERADADAHLYLWITNRSLPKGFALLEAWGFRYVTCLTWCKPSFGMGNYFRGQTEHILFGVRGSQMLKRKDVGTWFAAPRGPLGHSSKPAEFQTLVESCSPGPYLEIFARSARDGWSSWGGEL